MKEPEVLAATANVPSDKIAAAEGLWPNCFHHLHNVAKENALTICDYVFSLRSEINQPDHYRIDIILLLCGYQRSSTTISHSRK
jgi:hypothetical protein